MSTDTECRHLFDQSTEVVSVGHSGSPFEPGCVFRCKCGREFPGQLSIVSAEDYDPNKSMDPEFNKK